MRGILKNKRYIKSHTVAASKGFGDIKGSPKVVVHCQVLNVKESTVQVHVIN